VGDNHPGPGAPRSKTSFQGLRPRDGHRFCHGGSRYLKMAAGVRFRGQQRPGLGLGQGIIFPAWFTGPSSSLGLSSRN
jgi:hypothetical protein